MSIDKKDIVITTVTYGDRRNYLRQSIMSAYNEGIMNFVILGNGINYDLDDFVREFKEIGVNINTLSLAYNTGSAIGYRSVLERAQVAAPNYIFILDDDAQMLPDCLTRLLSSYDSLLSSGHQSDNLALAALRIQHGSDIDEGVLSETLRISSAFRRFHLRDIPRRIFRRLFPNPVKKGIMNVPYTVYSGLFFHKSLLDRYGLPEPSFVLYGDDLEFTYRITSGGGSIWLIPEAQINDIEVSWWCRGKFGNPFDALILGSSDSLVYYAFRNEVYFEAHCLKRKGMLYGLNKNLYMMILLLNALRKNRLSRYHILRKALKDGQEARLGVNSNFHL